MDLSLTEVKILAEIAKRNGTQDAALDVATQWAEGALTEIEVLQGLLKRSLVILHDEYDGCEGLVGNELIKEIEEKLK